MPRLLKIAALTVALAGLAGSAEAQTKVTYLFPAPAFLPAFSPMQIARHKGYYKAEGIDIVFQVAKGGADAAKQVGLGNVDIGNSIGDTPIIVRANGVTVKGVALLGGRTLTQITARKSANVKSFKDLKGKKIGVLSFQDTTFYNLLGVLKSAGLDKNDASIQSVGVSGVVKLMISGDVDAISGVPEWTAAIEAAGVPVDIYEIDSVFPAMAQAIIASDDNIKQRPQMIRGVIRATIKALKEVMDDPAQAARDYVAAVPQHKGKEKQIEDIMRRYNRLIYQIDNPAELGKFDEKRMLSVQKFYVDNGVIEKAVPIKDTYTNQFVGG
jgi:NitT/TauT family transport system substrate-binding protein